MPTRRSKKPKAAETVFVRWDVMKAAKMPSAFAAACRALDRDGQRPERLKPDDIAVVRVYSRRSAGVLVVRALSCGIAAYVAALYVPPNRRRSLEATEMLDAAERQLTVMSFVRSRAPASAPRYMETYVHTSNAPALNFFLRHGFRPVARLKIRSIEKALNSSFVRLRRDHW